MIGQLAVDCGCAPGHHMELTSQACAHCGLTEKQLFEHGNRPCMKGLWPLDVAVPIRQVLGLRLAPVGVEEGDLCLRGYSDGICLGKLENKPSDRLGGCACFISAPCGHCMSYTPECPVCLHREPEAE